MKELPPNSPTALTEQVLVFFQKKDASHSLTLDPFNLFPHLMFLCTDLSVLDIFLSVKSSSGPPMGYILLLAASLTHQLGHNRTDQQKELTFRDTGFFLFSSHEE